MTFRDWLFEVHDIDIDVIDDIQRSEYYDKYVKCGYGLDI